MALTFPLPVDQFMDLLAVEDVIFHAPPQMEINQTGGGEILAAQLAPTLWRGTVNMHTVTHQCAAAREALMERLSEPDASFLVYNTQKPFPASDPTGTLVQKDDPILYAVAANGDVTINRLPSNFWLRAGDQFSFTYGTNPVRYGLHRIVRDVQAGPGGVASGVVVHPRIRPGWPGSAPLQFVRPVCKAKMVPGNVNPATYGFIAASGLSFRWQQTLGR